MNQDIFDGHTKTNILINIIYDTEKFKYVTRKFFEVWRIKYKKTTKETESEFENFVYNVINSNIEALSHEDGTRELRIAVGDSVKKTKARWANMTLKSLEQKKECLLKKELNEVKLKYLKEGSFPYKTMSSPEDIIKIREEDLKEWKSSRFTPVSKYPYLLELSDSRINSTFKNDILICVTDVLKDDYNFDMNNNILRSPSSLVPTMFEVRKRGPKVNFAQLTRDGEIYKSKIYQSTSYNNENVEQVYYFSTPDDSTNNYTPSDNLESLKMQLLEITSFKKALSQLCLDNIDLELIRYMYSNIYLMERDFTVSSLLDHLGLAQSAKNYTLVENKLLKLPHYTLYTEIKDDDGNIVDQQTFNLFARARVYKEKNKRMCSVTRSYNMAIDRIHAQVMYRKELKKLKSQEAVNLAYLLEGRRVFEIGRGIDVKNTPFKYYINELSSHIYLQDKKTLKEKMEYIELLFEEIKNNQFIIKSYEIGNGFIYVNFYENVEKRKEMLNNTMLSLPNFIKD